jgi:diacylglycerol kinase (ATP)
LNRADGGGRGAASSAAASIDATMSKNSPAGNAFKGRTGVDRIVRATGYSLDGLRLAYRSESAFRQEVWAAALLLPAAVWLGRGWVEVALLAGSVMLVLIVELLNSGIEAAIDRVSFELHDLSKRAKDLASAAVFLSLLLCAAIWAAALWHRFVG